MVMSHACLTLTTSGRRGQKGKSKDSEVDPERQQVVQPGVKVQRLQERNKGQCSRDAGEVFLL